MGRISPSNKKEMDLPHSQQKALGSPKVRTRASPSPSSKGREWALTPELALFENFLGFLLQDSKSNTNITFR